MGDGDELEIGSQRFVDLLTAEGSPGLFAEAVDEDGAVGVVVGQALLDNVDDDAEALTAAAFGRFDKDAPTRAFSQLGPLAQRFPKSATLRYHLGIMLLWIGDVARSRQELRLAVQDGPEGAAVVEAAQAVLAELAKQK